MKLLVCMITYNRLDYSRITLSNFLNTIDAPYHLVIIDNHSDDGTDKWLKNVKDVDRVIINKENLYPGAACNIGWKEGLKEYPGATHLMRLDNDMNFAPDWATKAEKYFKVFPELGQLGLDDGALDSWNPTDTKYLFHSMRRSKSDDIKTINMWPGNVGGPCIIHREVYDRGARYDETPWEFGGDGKPIATEDVKFSFMMHKIGFTFGHPTEKLAWTFANESNWKDYPEYYKKTLLERGFTDKYKEVFGE